MTDAERHRGVDQNGRGSGQSKKASNRGDKGDLVVGRPEEWTDQSIEAFCDEFAAALNADRSEGSE